MKNEIKRHEVLDLVPAVYIGKSPLGFAFIVTEEALVRAAEEFGAAAVARFFSNGENAVKGGRKVSDALAGGPHPGPLLKERE